MNQISPSEWLENVTYDEMVVGQSARLLRTLSTADIQAFAAVSGDTNPTHLNSDYANDTLFHGVIAHGMWGGALFPVPARFMSRRICTSPGPCASATP